MWHMAISRNLSGRLQKLEERMIPLTVRRVWQIMTISSDGTTEPTGISIEWPSNSTPDRWQRMPQRPAGK